MVDQHVTTNLISDCIITCLFYQLKINTGIDKDKGYFFLQELPNEKTKKPYSNTPG